MKNVIHTHSDGNNVNATLSVQTDNLTKVLLTVANISLLLLHAFFIFEIEKHELKKLFIPTVVSTVIFTFFPWRYWLWRFFGKEYISLNATTLTYYYDYGLYKTGRQTIEHKNLKLKYEFVKKLDGEEYGKLHFISDDAKTKGQDYIYETAILAPKKELEKMEFDVSEILRSQTKP